MESNRLMAAFNTMWHEQNEIYRKTAKRFGLSESVFWILYSLTEAGGTLGQSEICAEICQPKQTTSSALKSLERNGIVTMSEAGGRRKSVTLTQKGQTLAEQTARKIIEAENTAMEELSAEEQKLFLELFNKYNKLLSKKIGDIK